MISAHIYIYRILRKMQEAERLENLENDNEQLVEDEPDDEVESVVDASEEAAYIWEVLTPEVKQPALPTNQLENFVQHCVYGTIHRIKEDGVLACGRIVSNRYTRIVDFDPVEWPVCQQCRP